MANQMTVASRISEIAFGILKEYSNAGKVPVDIANAIHANISQQSMGLAQEFISNVGNEPTVAALQQYLTMYLNNVISAAQQQQNNNRGFGQQQNTGWGNSNQNNFNNNQNNSWGGGGGWNNNSYNNNNNFNNQNNQNNSWGSPSQGANHYGSFGSGSSWNNNAPMNTGEVVYGVRPNDKQEPVVVKQPDNDWINQPIPKPKIMQQGPFTKPSVDNIKIKLQEVSNTLESPSKGKVSFESKKYLDSKESINYELNSVQIKDVVCSEEDAIELASTIKDINAERNLSILKYNGSMVINAPMKEIKDIHCKLKELLTGVAVLATDPSGNYAAIVNVLNSINTPASREFEKLLVCSFNDKFEATNICGDISIERLADIQDLFSGTNEKVNKSKQNNQTFLEIVNSVCKASLQQFIVNELVILDSGSSKNIDDVVNALKNKVVPSGKCYIKDYWKFNATTTNKRSVELLKEIKTQLAMYTVLSIPKVTAIANECNSAVNFSMVNSNTITSDDGFSALEFLIYEGTRAFNNSQSNSSSHSVVKIRHNVKGIKYTLRYTTTPDNKGILLTRSDGRYEL